MTTKLIEQLENSTKLGEFLSLLDQAVEADEENHNEIKKDALYNVKWILLNSKLIGRNGEASKIGERYELSNIEDQLSLLRDIQKVYGDDVPFCREFNSDPKHADHIADVVQFWKLDDSFNMAAAMKGDEAGVQRTPMPHPLHQPYKVSSGGRHRRRRRRKVAKSFRRRRTTRRSRTTRAVAAAAARKWRRRK